MPSSVLCGRCHFADTAQTYAPAFLALAYHWGPHNLSLFLFDCICCFGHLKQQSILFANVSVSVHAALPYRNTDSTVDQNIGVSVFLDYFVLYFLLILLCATSARPIFCDISALGLLTRDPMLVKSLSSSSVGRHWFSYNLC